MPNRNSTLRIQRRPERFVADARRVIAKFFNLGAQHRFEHVIQRVMELDEPTVQKLLDRVVESFAERHRDITIAFDRHFGYIKHHVEHPDALSLARQRLIGSYFTMEYSIESAALFNPSIVPHPDQSGVDDDEVRFLMSLRATGEGHVSSIVFRTGTIDANCHIHYDPPPRFTAKMRVRADRSYEKKLFFLKLIEMGAYTDNTGLILNELGENFTQQDLARKIDEIHGWDNPPHDFSDTADTMLWLARSNYELVMPPDTDPSEVVIFPTSENESRGIEDVRMTRFIDDDGDVTYFGTYTAYNGFRILPQIFETRDFHTIQVHTLNGKYVQNKGMALFPRKIDGQYFMISRLDGENMFIMKSDNVHFWNDAEKLQAPVYPWEFVQIGNCGPPIETEAGWLLLTHGVGPVRQYCIGASLLDLDDPSRVIGHLRYPLIMPQEDERDGYVPNVVYTCGAMINAGQLVIPYAVSDSASTVATIGMDELLLHLTQKSPACPMPDRRVYRRAG
jgi:predicted GH43/DUF377 family glycosyl hydrolase